MTKQMMQRDMVVIGGGAGGLNVASGAAQLGFRVTLLEKNEQLGGECLHSGCVPSKSLLACAKMYKQLRMAQRWGVTVAEDKVDFTKVKQHIEQVISTIQHHDDPQRFRDYGCEVIFGESHFISPNTLMTSKGLRTAKRIILATGSHPVIPDIPGLQHIDYYTNENIFSLSTLPKRLLILGAGAIGVELAQAFACLGVAVTLIEKGKQILPVVSECVADIMQQVLQQDGVRVILQAQLQAVEKQQQGDYQAQIVKNNGEVIQGDFDALLIAVGRAANTEGLQLDKAGVICAGNQGVVVDKRLRTSNKRIYAVGDVIAGLPKYTHLAEYQAGVVMANIAFCLPKKAKGYALPAVVFTDPEIAMVGMSEDKALQQPGAELLEFAYNDIDRALTEGQTVGKWRVVVAKKRVLSATIIGAHAGELIAEFAFVIHNRLPYAKISATIHAYPTWAQGNRRVINQYYGKRLFSPRVRKLLRWLHTIMR